MTPGFAKTRAELPWLYYPRNDRVIINQHNFTPTGPTGVFTAGPATASRNNFSGAVGYRFTAQSNWTLTAMGRWVGTTFATSHQVRIYTEAGAFLAGVTVTNTSTADGNGWRYELLGSPLSLASGTQYRVGVTEINAGDNWADEQAVSGKINTSYVNTFQSAYAATQNAFPGILSISGRAFAWAQLYY